MTKKILSLLLIFTLIAPAALASKVQQQGIVTTTDCTNRSVSNANCLPLTSQVYDSFNGQTLAASIAAGSLGGSGGAGVQQLSNPGFEIGSTGAPPTSWTLSAATGTLSTSVVYDGKNSESLSLSSQQPVLSQDVTPTNPLASVNMEASCHVYTTLTNAQVCARLGGAVSGSCVTVPSTGTWQYVPVNFVGPSSGSMGVEVTTAASTSGTIYVDDCYVGPARNLSQVSQSSVIGTSLWANGVNAWTQTTTTTNTLFPANASISAPTLTGVLIAPATRLPEVIIPSAAPGCYKVTASGGFLLSSVSADGYFTIGDGTNFGADNGTATNGAMINTLGSVLGTLCYTTPQTNLTFGIYGRTNLTSKTLSVGLSDAASTTTMVVEFEPSQSQLAVNSNSVGASYSVVTGGNGYGSINTGVRHYTAVQSSTGPDITYTSSATLGDSWTINTPGVYSMNLNDLAASATIQPYISYNASVFTVGVHSLIGNSADCNASAQNGCSTGLSYYLNAGDVIRVQEQDSANGGTASGFIGFSITKVMPSQAAPLLVGSVTSSGAGQYHTEAAIVSCTSGGCTITSQTGLWLSSVTRFGTGGYSVNITASEFSANPMCNVTAQNSPYFAEGISSSTTLVTVNVANAIGPTAVDAGFNISCMGPH